MVSVFMKISKQQNGILASFYLNNNYIYALKSKYHAPSNFLQPRLSQ